MAEHRVESRLLWPNSYMSDLVSQSRQTVRDHFSSYGFPSLQPFVVAICWCEHMARFAQQLCIFLHIPPAVATSLDVMKIKVLAVATSLALCPSFCHDFLLHHSPFLVVLRIALPDNVRDRGFCLCYRCGPGSRQVGVWMGFRPIFRDRLVAHPIQKEHAFSVANTTVVSFPFLSELVHGQDLPDR